MACLYATAPFLQSEDLMKGFDLLKQGPWNYVFSATSFGYPIFRSFECKENGALSLLFPDQISKRSQDLKEAYHDAGQFYIGTVEAWKEKNPAFDENRSVVVLPRWRVQDIDTLEDWKRAELMWKALGD